MNLPFFERTHTQRKKRKKNYSNLVGSGKRSPLFSRLAATALDIPNTSWSASSAAHLLLFFPPPVLLLIYAHFPLPFLHPRSSKPILICFFYLFIRFFICTGSRFSCPNVDLLCPFLFSFCISPSLDPNAATVFGPKKSFFCDQKFVWFQIEIKSIPFFAFTWQKREPKSKKDANELDRVSKLA